MGQFTPAKWSSLGGHGWGSLGGRRGRALWKEGLRYRLHLKIEGARPDIVFKSRRLAIFIDGCFWHGCPLHYVRPRSRSEFWANKLQSNTARDRAQTVRLIEKGWTVLRFWEHEVEGGLDQLVAVVLCAQNNSTSGNTSRFVVTCVEPQSDGTELWLIEDLFNRCTCRKEHRQRNPSKL
jgi:DNA mismatch endonuclease (patch repair protein)